MDVSGQTSVKSLFNAVDAQFGGVDILVNNAAHRGKAELFDMSVEQWDMIFAVTVLGTFLCAREAVARMKATGRGGSIVNISSGRIRSYDAVGRQRPLRCREGCR